MADEPSNASPEQFQARSNHAPQHASQKHVRPLAAAGDTPEAGSGMPPHHRLWGWVKSHKKVSIPLAVVLVLAALAAVPPTRYLLAGTVLRKNFSVTVTDSQTHKPVTSATVLLEGKSVVTNNKGVAVIKANVGHGALRVTKKYYADSSKSVLVPIGSQKQTEGVSLVATGRQVPVVIHDKINGQPVANITVAAQGTEAKTDAHGELTLVLPAGKDTVPATLSGSGYNKTSATIKVTAAADPANTFLLTPSGKLYFLSNKSGKLDVVKTDLDGANRETVLAGTGSEAPDQTVLLASQDWHYLALLSKRDGGDNAKLFLINTANDSLSTVDEGDVDFTLTGWSGHTFVYSVYRHNMQQWQPNRQALKSFDADSGKGSTLDQTTAGGNNNNTYFSESIGDVSIVKDEIIYAKSFVASTVSDMGSHQATITIIKPDGSDKQTLRSWSYPSSAPYYNVVSSNITMRAYESNGLYAFINFSPPATADNNLYEYSDGKVTTVSGKTADNFYDNDYITYLFSPSNTKTFWSEPRDGKNTLFVGDQSGDAGKEVASLSDYQTYGWYTDKYLLVSKNGSELYVMPATGGTALKITDYYKPGLNFLGYGGGYGGL